MKRISVLLAALLACISHAITLTLDNSFIETYKRRVTISGTFTVDFAHAHPNGIATDGDMHIAGSCDTVGLPMVAEIMNARKYDDCVSLVHQLEGTDQTAPISGVWRLWFEHPGSHNQVQFGNNPLHGPDTNPDHVFEIHPITKFGPHSLLDSLEPIKEGSEEFEYKKASAAFAQWRNKAFQVQPSGDGTKLTSTQASYNYVKFRVAKLPDSTFEVEDGTFMYVSVYDVGSSKRLKRKVRIVMADGTQPQQVLRDANIGEKVTVIGLPRVSLSLVSWRRDHPEGRDWTLPFEMVIVAIK